MFRLQLSRLFLLPVLMVLAACAKQAEPFATSTEPAALMRVVFPDSKEGAAERAEMPSELGEEPGNAGDDSTKADFSAELVVRLSPDQVVLIVSGVPVAAGHPTHGLLMAYWFERHEKNWLLSKKEPQAVFTGFYGQAGDVKLIEPADDLKVLAVENGSCWQGMCGHWLHLFRVDGQGMTDLLGKEEAIQLGTDADGATTSCEGLMKRGAGTRVRVSTDEYSEAYGCVGVSAKWYVRVRKDKSGPGDIVIEFSGKQTSAELVPIERPAVSASAPVAESAPQATNAAENAHENDSSEVEAPTEEYLVTVHNIRETLVYRYRNGQYEHLSGKNPAPEL